MGILQTCDHDGPRGRLFRFCGVCGTLIHPKMVPLSECERRHELKRDIGYLFCVDCGAELPLRPATRRLVPPAPPAAPDSSTGADDRTGVVLEYTSKVRA